MKSVLLALLISTLTLAHARPARISRKQAKTIEFVDVTSQADIRWGIKQLAPGVRYLIETMGGGGGFLDYNTDGLLDIYLVCYSQTPQSDPKAKLKDALYRNNGDGTFTDVTESAGINNSMRGTGMASGDFDNDGWPDIYVTGFGASRLYRNNRDGTFADATERAGVNNKLWGASAAFFDYDADGFLDLFVCNYLNFDPDGKVP
ncbi:MAG TPA: VCBS repeat-containing protein, partial [Pyrinomonadaceae bacterium]|nr:VCBS repeat-containing protein [Pyrinomonadaceae bacterium]